MRSDGDVPNHVESLEQQSPKSRSTNPHIISLSQAGTIRAT